MVHIFFPPRGQLKVARLAVSTLTLAMTLALAGCASTPPPDGALNQAQMQLQAARDADAASYDPIDLGNAQNKFQQAQNAVAKRDYDEAAQLADEARADAELARAKARLAAARAQIQSKTTANQQLREQIDQSLADQQQQDQSQAAGLPAQQQTQDMPAPSSSQLGEPIQQGQGFQTYPQNPNPDQPAPPSSTDQGGHP
ncbi:DUF4398 domain-containing protein [Dyella telluris]|uniref:DUF4398 domain-containing protein n=1 Tax=Dyella telluris TaxID=2763498 RepID=A0A7G8Q7J1_9GAMM|nr:DUF4398 domain-containing protein [Dyella telluris]QNK02749.1 DUF4398 domain-containing protein [Dyella telluris]